MDETDANCFEGTLDDNNDTLTAPRLSDWAFPSPKTAPIVINEDNDNGDDRLAMDMDQEESCDNKDSSWHP
jgi:hypothetical protein